MECENSEGEHIRKPVQILNGRYYFGPVAYLVARFVDEKDHEDGNYRGLSGAPVYRSDGEFCGAVSKAFFAQGGQEVFGVTPVSEIVRTVSMARMASSELRLEAIPSSPLARGDCVAVASVWGDVYEGQSGYVCWVEGREVLTLGHPVDTRLRGPCMFALLEADQLAVVGMVADRFAVAAVNQLVGAVVYDGTGGAYALWGVAPASLKLEFRFIESGVPGAVEEAEVWIAKDKRRLFRSFSNAVHECVSRMVAPRSGRPVDATIDVDTGGRVETWQVEGFGSKEWDEWIRQFRATDILGWERVGITVRERVEAEKLMVPGGG